MLGAIEGPHAGIGFVPDAEVLELGEHRLPGLEQFSHVAPVHAYKRNSATAGEGCSMSERALQEAGEGRDRHLAGPHGEFAMADTAESGRMPVDRDVVGWIGEDEVSSFGSHQPIEASSTTFALANRLLHGPAIAVGASTQRLRSSSLKARRTALTRETMEYGFCSQPSGIAG
jgi:hypothetical protein